HEGDVRSLAGRSRQIRAAAMAGELPERCEFLRVADQEGMLDPWASGLQVSHQGAVVEARVPVHAHIGAGLGSLREVLYFGYPVRRQDVDRKDPGTKQRKDHADELRDIRQVYQYTVALDQSGPQQAGGQGAGTLVQFGIGPALIATDHGY